MSFHSSSLTFRSEIIETGLLPPDDIISDGQIHRFKTDRKNSDKPGFYALFSSPNGFNAGFFGCWRTGIYQTWQSRPQSSLSDDDIQFMAQIKSCLNEQREKEHEQRGNYASSVWAEAMEASAHHPYLKRKMLTKLGNIKYANAIPCRDFFANKDKQTSLTNVILIPVLNAEGQIQSLQAINGRGDKFFMKGGKTKHGRFTLHGENDTIYVCEGYATGATVHQLTNATTVITFNASNLAVVAPEILANNPNSNVIVAADNDHIKELEGKGNKGLEIAKQLADNHHISYSAPIFDDSNKGTDWNDYALSYGCESAHQALLCNLVVIEQEPKFENFQDALNALREDKDSHQAFDASIQFILDANTLAANRMRKQLSDVSEIGISDIRAAVKQRKADTTPPALSHHQIADEYCQKFGLSKPIGEYGSLWIYNPALSIWEAKELKAIGVDIAIKFGHEERCQRENDYKAIASHTYNYLENKGFFDKAPKGIMTPDHFYSVKGNELALLPHSADHRARFRVSLSAAPEGSKPQLLLTMLNEAFKGNYPAEQIRQLRMFFGMALFGMQNKEQRAVLLYGAAGSGKSLCLKVMEAIVPREYITNVSPLDMALDYKVATLAGKLLNLVPEIDNAVLVPSDKFKSIIGGDTIQAREPYGKAFSFTPDAANWFNGNFFLNTRDLSEGFWRRWGITHFTNTKSAELRDPALLDKIVSNELPEVLRWAMDGVVDYLENGLYLSPAHYACLDKWKNSGNSVASWLQDNEDNNIGHRIDISGQQPLKVSFAYTIYKDWCQHNSCKPLNKHEYKEQMALLGNVCSMYQGYSCYTALYDSRTGFKKLAIAS
ncbi:DUF5906 domain-containing protein [Photobacterium leiognathi]|uniref:DUF5906 domain-containing protein n=1 Tax=Photobacterium leiognathi TaxID=553611 RepID=UPI0029827F5B|nr:DUF5906 domain-containing protein [Photobacterium leiognathi]